MSTPVQKMNADKVGKNLWVGGLPTDPEAVDTLSTLVTDVRNMAALKPSMVNKLLRSMPQMMQVRPSSPAGATP